LKGFARGHFHDIGMWEVQTPEAAEAIVRHLSNKSWDADIDDLRAALLDLAPAYKAYRQLRRREKLDAKSAATPFDMIDGEYNGWTWYAPVDEPAVTMQT
jgi:hypothetical protein